MVAGNFGSHDRWPAHRCVRPFFMPGRRPQGVANVIEAGALHGGFIVTGKYGEFVVPSPTSRASPLMMKSTIWSRRVTLRFSRPVPKNTTSHPGRIRAVETLELRPNGRGRQPMSAIKPGVDNV